MSQLNISKTLTSKRKEKGVTQEELASFIGVSKASVSKWETGVSYPDITFLPQLAAYFNITVDELINYEPQMIKQDIRKLYHRLSMDFTQKPFDEVIDEIREKIKRYYSCMPLLLQMGIIMLNHQNLAGDKNLDLINEAAELFRRVSSQSDDLELNKQAHYMEAVCHMMIGEYEQAIDLMQYSKAPLLNEISLLAQCYALSNRREMAVQSLQISIYQNLMHLISDLISLLSLEADDTIKAETIWERVTSVAETFQLQKLLPATMLKLYCLGATVIIGRGDFDSAMTILQKYCELATSGIFPMELHGDDFFNKMGDWLNELDLGVDMPRNEKSIKRDLISIIANNPAFEPLHQRAGFQAILEKLNSVLGD